MFICYFFVYNIERGDIMPEKPEVITVAKSLEPRIIHREITGCNIYWDNIIASPSVSDFQKNILHEHIHSVTTRGKFIVIELDHYSLLIHLRMEGKFFFREKGIPLEKHEHVEFLLDDQISFRYHDVRKFGKMYLIPKEDTYQVKPLSELGYEYYDEGLTVSYLKEKFQKSHLPIKTTLLDQSIIAGIGNIYDDEILYLCRLNPLRETCTLKKKDMENIITYTREVLNHAVELGGTTIKSFTSSEGVHGLFQNELLIHGQKTCPNCGGEVTKIFVGGRGTYYCKKCQKKQK
jgi:formamidopyrimidine-DNA glycosylase